MPDFEAIEVLTQAKERIMEHGWGKGTVEWREERYNDTETYCLEDGLCRERGGFIMPLYSNNPAVHAAHYVKKVLDLPQDGPEAELWRWNDACGRSAGEIFAALDDAILLAKES